MVVCHPFDTIRTRLQISPERFSKSFFNCARNTFEKESVFGFYKGFLPPFFSQAVYKSVIFTTSTKFRTEILPNSEFLAPYLNPTRISLLSGAIAGGVNAFLVAPVELVRNRLQVQYDAMERKGSRGRTRQEGSVRKLLTTVIRTEGIFPLWRGLGTTILRDSLGVACYFLAFDSAKQHLKRRFADPEKESLLVLTSGAIGGITFWAVALPFDTIKSLIQVSSGDSNSKYNNLLSTTRALVKEEGVGQLFRGWQAAFSRGIPGAAITFWTFDKTTKLLNEFEDP